jgi:hypothetical protein
MSTKQVQEAYIVAAARTPIGKSGRGVFRNTRPDDLLVKALQGALAQVPGLDPKAIEDAIVGCSFPEAEQGMNVARVGALLAGLPASVGGVTVNRFCASGLTAVQMAADRIRVGEADADFDQPDVGFHVRDALGAVQRQLAATAERNAAHRRHHGHLRVAQAQHEVLQLLHLGLDALRA